MFANFRRQSTMRPANARLPLALRFYPHREKESRTLSDPLGRDPRLARVEALLMLADDPDKIAPQFNSGGVYAPQNGIVKNLNRKKLYETWLRKSYRFTATVKVFDKTKGEVEFAEDKSELSRYRIVANLGAGSHNDKELLAQLVKGATLSFYGRLDTVEEARWPAKIVTLEFSAVESLR